VLIVIALLTILFLSQKETKKIFVLAAASKVTPDIILEESTEVQNRGAS
jgi:hypothetical protein